MILIGLLIWSLGFMFTLGFITAVHRRNKLDKTYIEEPNSLLIRLFVCTVWPYAWFEFGCEGDGSLTYIFGKFIYIEDISDTLDLD